MAERKRKSSIGAKRGRPNIDWGSFLRLAGGPRVPCASIRLNSSAAWRNSIKPLAQRGWPALHRTENENAEASRLRHFVGRFARMKTDRVGRTFLSDLVWHGHSCPRVQALAPKRASFNRNRRTRMSDPHHKATRFALAAWSSR